MSDWTVLVTNTFEQWIDSLPERHQDELYAHMRLLEEAGPHLMRPVVGKITGSALIPHLKELRTKVGRFHYRCFFAFDEERQAWMLIGGEKSASFRSEKAKQAWYTKMIAQAEAIWQEEVIT